MPNNNSKKNIAASQNFIPIQEIKDGVIVLDDGTLISISLVTSINIFLKSPEEQASTVANFQAFLNTLEFPVQISIQSRKMDIEPYIEKLELRLKEQQNEIIKLQTIEYIAFIKNFTESVNIMDKQFFLVVSYKPVLKANEIGSIFNIFSNKKSDSNQNTKKVFQEAKSQLEQRVAILSSGLSRTGVKVKTIDTEAAIEIFHSIFNSGEYNYKN